MRHRVLHLGARGAVRQAILERSAQLELSPQDIDLLIDLRYVGEADLGRLKDFVLDFLSLMPVGSQYRSTILSGSSALKHVGSVPQDDVGEIEREELRLWMQLQSDLFGVHNLVFSDYGVVHPDFSAVGPNKNRNAKIRHTIGGKIKVYRGHKLRDHPNFKQYHALSEKVRNAPEYLGRHFSAGDRYIDDCADGNVGPGNLGTWVFVDMNHHIEHTAAQVHDLATQIDESFTPADVEAAMQYA